MRQLILKINTEILLKYHPNGGKTKKGEFYSFKRSTFHIQLSLGLPSASVHIVCSYVLCGRLIDDEPVLCPIFLKAILSISAQFHSILHPERDEERQKESKTERDKEITFIRRN